MVPYTGTNFEPPGETTLDYVHFDLLNIDNL